MSATTKRPDLINNGQSPVVTSVGSPERAGKDTGTNDVQRGRPGVFLDWKQRNHLKRTIPVRDDEIDDVPLVLARLKRALKGEDERGRRRHWTYSVPRHMALMKFLRLYEGIRDDRQDDDPTFGLAGSA